MGINNETIVIIIWVIGAIITAYCLTKSLIDKWEEVTLGEFFNAIFIGICLSWLVIIFGLLSKIPVNKIIFRKKKK